MVVFRILIQKLMYPIFTVRIIKLVTLQQQEEH